MSTWMVAMVMALRASILALIPLPKDQQSKWAGPKQRWLHLDVSGFYYSS